MVHINNSVQNFLPIDSNNLRVLQTKVLNPRKKKLFNPVTHYWGAVLEPHNKGNPPNNETHSLSPSIHGNNSSLNNLTQGLNHTDVQ